jgi:hypothetical protein
MFLAFAVSVAGMLTFFLTMLEPWLRPWLSPGLASALPTLNDRQPDRLLVAFGVMLAIIGLTIGSVFAWRRSSRPTEPRLTSISAAGGVCLGSFGALAIGPFIAMFPIMGAEISLATLGFRGAEAWLHGNFAQVSLLMLAVMAILTAVAYLYGRWRVPKWEDRTSTLIRAAMTVAGIYLAGSFGMLLVVPTIVAALKAAGMIG